ncbi:MAG: MBL fold metallo-hydrolase [Candidatus Zixiibacteriota bacterium]
MKIHEVKQFATTVFIVEQNDKLFIIDAGMHGREKEIFAKIEEIGKELEEVSFIAITHAHSDHTGGLKTLAQMTQAKIICQKNESEFIKSGINANIKSKNRLVSLLVDFGTNRFPSVEPDIVFESKYDLGHFGIDGYMIHTPGHTHGSASIILQDKIAIIGDVAMKVLGLRLTPITHNQKILEKSLKTLLALDLEEYYITHGGKIEKSKLESLLD